MFQIISMLTEIKQIYFFPCCLTYVNENSKISCVTSLPEDLQ